MHGEGRSGAGTQRTTREPVSEGEMALSGLARRIAGGRDSGAVKKLASVLGLGCRCRYIDGIYAVHQEHWRTVGAIQCRVAVFLRAGHPSWLLFEGQLATQERTCRRLLFSFVFCLCIRWSGWGDVGF